MTREIALCRMFGRGLATMHSMLDAIYQQANGRHVETTIGVRTEGCRLQLNATGRLSDGSEIKRFVWLEAEAYDDD